MLELYAVGSDTLFYCHLLALEILEPDGILWYPDFPVTLGSSDCQSDVGGASQRS